MRLLLYITIYVLTLAGCSSGREVKPTSTQSTEMSRPNPNLHSAKASQKKASRLPKAVVYRTNKDLRDYVPVKMDGGKVRLVSYPAPTDITESTRPIALAEGYLLDKQGVGVNSVFLDWTRDTYSKFTETPRKGDIMEHINPSGWITVIVELPMTTSEAEADTAAVNKLIRNGFPGAKVIKGRPIQIGDPNNVIGTRL